MKVHIILHHWCTLEEEGQDIRGVYGDKDVAIREMRALAEEERAGVQDDWGKKFDTDLCTDDDCYIAYGWYADGLGMDSTWSWSLETEDVQ